MPKPLPRKPLPPSWRVYQFRNSLVKLGMVLAETEAEALEKAFERWGISENLQSRVFVRREE